jgi:hypothetical protein
VAAQAGSEGDGKHMKAITLYQPWANAVVMGLKKIETRSWKTSYTGRIAIHASKTFPSYAKQFAQTERALGRCPSRLIFGAIIGFVTIMGMRFTEDVAPQISALERLYGDYSLGRWAWMLCDPEELKNPIPIKGARGLWEWDEQGGGSGR